MCCLLSEYAALWSVLLTNSISAIILLASFYCSTINLSKEKKLICKQMHKSSCNYLIAEAGIIAVYLKWYSLCCQSIIRSEETDETFIKCYLLRGFICGWNGPSSHHSSGFTWMNSLQDVFTFTAVCNTKKLYNTTKMSYSYNYHGMDKCFNIFIKGDKLCWSRLFLFFLFWTERKTSSTWFNRVSLCIIVPKVAVFYF